MTKPDKTKSYDTYTDLELRALRRLSTGELAWQEVCGNMAAELLVARAKLAALREWWPLGIGGRVPTHHTQIVIDALNRFLDADESETATDEVHSS